jgi:hypothetical protein
MDRGDCENRPGGPNGVQKNVKNDNRKWMTRRRFFWFYLWKAVEKRMFKINKKIIDQNSSIFIVTQTSAEAQPLRMYGRSDCPQQPTYRVASSGGKPRESHQPGDKRMKNLLKAFSVVALAGAMALPVLADDTTTNATTAPAAPTTDAKDQKDLKKVIEDQGINYVETAQKGITLSGYVDTSYTEQFAGAGQYAAASGGFRQNPGSGPSNTQSVGRQFDTDNNTFNINAVKIALEKALPDKNEWAAGFRIDTIYGEDAKYLNDTAINGPTNTSGLALEQALVKFRIPVGNGLDIYAGKFVTFLGYEVIESPANLNFSRGLLFTNLIPLTHTGVYADYKFNDTFEAKFGVVDGWNNSTSPSVGNITSATGDNDSSSFGKALTGQLNINAPGKNANITQSFIYSPDGEPGVVGVDNGPLAVYDIWGNWNPTFVKDSNLLLGFNVDFGYNGAAGTPAAPSTYATTASDATVAPGAHDSNTFFGVALYAQYKFSKVFNLAGRAEYIHSDESYNPKFGAGGYTTGAVTTGGVTTGGVFHPGDQDDFAYTLTASFNIWDNLLTRVEYRIDDLSGNTTGTGHTSIQNEISLNAVYSF